MFKNTNSKRMTGILLALVLVTACFIGGSIARYVTSTSSEDDARVAKWGFSETPEPVTMNLFKNEYKLEDNTVVAKSNDDADIIAPGLNGVSKFKFVTSSISPEVMYEVKISVDDSEIAPEIKNHPGIQWKVDNGNWVTWDEMVASLVSLSGDPSGMKVYAPGELHNNFKNTTDHTIAWQWLMDAGYDVEDTAMGNLAASGTPITAKIVVTVLAQQTDVDSTGMLEGNGSVVNSLDPQPLMFRADADYETFDSVEINGTTLNPSNYTTEEGSIKVILKKEYLETLPLGSHKITINTNDGKAIESRFTKTKNSTIIHNDIIPEGGVYYVGVPTYNIYNWDDIYNAGFEDPHMEAPQITNYTGYTAKYEAGDKFPQTVNIGDIYVYGDYEYRYGMISKSEGIYWQLNENQNGWGVLSLSKTKTSHGQPLTTINNKDLTHMEYTFGYSQTSVSPIIPNTVISTTRMFEGSKIITSPTLPNSVIYAIEMFYNCDSLTNPPIIPNSVLNTSAMFYSCDSLTNPPIIPQNVINASGMFMYCTNLEKPIEIHATNLEDVSSMISGTKVTEITGSISKALKKRIFTESGMTYVDPELDHTGTIPEGGTYYRGVTSNKLNDYTGYTTKYETGESFPTPALAGDVYVYDGREYRVDSYYNLNGYDPETDSQIECWEFVGYGNVAGSWTGKIITTPTTELLDRINGLLVDPSYTN